ncbi:hypothetical protein D3C73_1004210 [compost metagenome]
MRNCDSAMARYTNNAMVPVACISTSYRSIFDVAIIHTATNAKALEISTPTYGVPVRRPVTCMMRCASPRRDSEYNMRDAVYKAELKQLHTDVSTMKLTMACAYGTPSLLSATL